MSLSHWRCSGAGSAPRSAATAAGPFLVETCVSPSRATVGTTLSSAKCPSQRRGCPPWSPPAHGATSRGAAAAQVVQICHKGPDCAEATEENR